jgi:ligand-binding sensor domain-containing protein
MRRLLLISCLILPAILLRSQSFTMYNYSVAEGLPSSEVYDAFEDSKGFLWFSTDNGVVKFDGNKMEVFSTREGLKDPVVFSSYEDADGKIWFRSYSGQLT